MRNRLTVAFVATMFASVVGLLVVPSRADVPVVVKPFQDRSVTGSETIELAEYFTNTQTPLSPTVLVKCSVNGSDASFAIALATDKVPNTVGNFMEYVNAGRYANLIVDRLAPGFVVQAGAVTLVGDTVTPIATFPPITNESRISNTRGTVAMAKLGGDPNSATSSWFVNLSDNHENLDNQNGGFAVFGSVVDGGMAAVDTIAQLPVRDLSAMSSVLNSAPLQSFDGGAPTVANLVTISNVFTLPFGVTSSDPTSFKATVAGSKLTVAFVGSADSADSAEDLQATITVVASNTTGDQVTGSFLVSKSGSSPSRGCALGGAASGRNSRALSFLWVAVFASFLAGRRRRPTEAPRFN